MVISKASEDQKDHLKRLLEYTHKNPHSFLGLHEEGDGKIIRIFRPGARKIQLEVFGEIKEADLEHSSGLFVCRVPNKTTHLDYRIYHQNGLLEHDPFSFTPTLRKEDIASFKEGAHEKLYEMMGGRLFSHAGCEGAKFTVYAPNALQVALVCDTNYFDGRLFPLREIDNSGVFEIFVPGLEEGEKYKFEIRTKEGHVLLKTDPYGLYFEMRPKNAAILFDPDHFKFEDDRWHKSKTSTFDSPMNIYEVHFGSWKRKGSDFLNYRELAEDLVEYCQMMGYTHVEMLPISEHPFDGSWGYQVTGFYGISSRFGTPEDFQYFVNHLHNNEIGVFIDWVPGHFPIDDFALARFDGGHVFEHSEMGIHPHWNTLFFDYAKPCVRNFLIGSALYLLDKMHVDGIRVDAISSIVHLDFGRNEGEWKPNIYGGKENLEGLTFLKQFNEMSHRLFPQAITIAEDTSTFQSISHPLDQGGLGFDYKWNVGFCNDSMKYFKTNFEHREKVYKELIFTYDYLYTEKFISSYSHDEVSHEKDYLIASMPGNTDQKFGNFKSYMAYLMTYPGKKLLFMGTEIAQINQWYFSESLHWNLLKEPLHQMAQLYVKDLNMFYLSQVAFYENEFEKKNFEWVVNNDAKGGVIAYIRHTQGKAILCYHHFMDKDKKNYLCRPPKSSGKFKKITKLFSSDEKKYGGMGISDAKINPQKGELLIDVSPFTTIVFEVEFEK
ncbi:MAG: 1,4-alpha-glucan branching enzyme GlgB [Chlamydiia bacterium]|nr:1,4-alpha-glucan branching enzyme GlgB [Chlamydiia bacterium]